MFKSSRIKDLCLSPLSPGKNAVGGTVVICTHRHSMMTNLIQFFSQCHKIGKTVNILQKQWLHISGYISNWGNSTA